MVGKLLKNNMKPKTKKEISPSQIKQIFKDDYSLFKKIEKNVFCGNCSDYHITTIVDYRGYILNNLYLLLQGKCKRCGHDVGRVLETGDVEKYRVGVQSILSE